MITKYSDEWNAVNTLLSYLRDGNAVKRCKEWYSRFGNSAPPQLLERQINTVQKILDEAT